MIRQAQLKDFEAIKTIKETVSLDIAKVSSPEYRFQVQKNGFLMPGNLSQQEFAEDIKKTYLVYEENGVVKGFLRVDEVPEMNDDSGTFWFMPELKENYFSLPHACIGSIAVLREVTQKGVATQLLNIALEKVRERGVSCLYSFVAISPVTNIPSLFFHEKNEFKRIMVSDPETFFEMKNYQCFLYGRMI